ncbi:hypothetical protein AV650_28750 (plasmid) [Serratia fonticola]|nr:hypothetical protein AV650_28750 [Serratia fonticola]
MRTGAAAGGLIFDGTVQPFKRWQEITSTRKEHSGRQDVRYRPAGAGILMGPVIWPDWLTRRGLMPLEAP